jgi:hypothetical protein
MTKTIFDLHFVRTIQFVGQRKRMLPQLEARLQTSATLFNFCNRSASHLSAEKGILCLLPCRSGSAEQLSLVAPILVTACLSTT